MLKTVCTKAEIKKIVNGYGIERAEERRVDFDGNQYGRTLVFYGVCLEEGRGDMIESFKTMAEAERFCLEN